MILFLLLHGLVVFQGGLPRGSCPGFAKVFFETRGDIRFQLFEIVRFHGPLQIKSAISSWHTEVCGSDFPDGRDVSDAAPDFGSGGKLGVRGGKFDGRA